MKNIAFIFFILLFFEVSLMGQDSPYIMNWNAIEQDLRDGLNRSALEKINLLETKLETEQHSIDNQDEYLKAILFKAKLESELEEKGLEKAIKRFEIKMGMAKPPLKSLMQSMLAELYEQYLNHHLWKIQDRSHMAEIEDQERAEIPDPPVRVRVGVDLCLHTSEFTRPVDDVLDTQEEK